MSQKQSTAYVDPSEPESLGGVNAFAKAHKIPQPQAKQQLEQLLSYTLHKPRRRRFPTLPTKVFSNNEQFVMDLVHIQTLAKYNKGYKYLLTVIDVFSRYAWVEPLTVEPCLRKTMDKVRSSPTSESTDGFWR